MNDHVGKPIDLDVLVEHHPAALSAHQCLWRHGRCEPSARHSAAHQPLSISSVNQEFDKALRQIGGNKALFLSMSRMLATRLAGLRAADQKAIAQYGQC
jgi:hypothetical protein